MICFFPHNPTLQGATIAHLAANIASDPSLQAAITAQVKREQADGAFNSALVKKRRSTKRVSVDPRGTMSGMVTNGARASVAERKRLSHRLSTRPSLFGGPSVGRKTWFRMPRLTTDTGPRASFFSAAEPDTAYDFDSAPFKYCMLANAASYKPLSAIRASIGLAATPPGSLRLSSLHIIGVDDSVKELSEEVCSTYDHTSCRKIFYLHGGHTIGRITRNDDGVCAAVQRAGQVAIGTVRKNPPADPLVWKPLSAISDMAKIPNKQLALVRTKGITKPSTMQTIVDALANQPPDAVLMRIARAGDVRTTYGECLKFIQPGGGGDLRRLGVKPGEVVAYCTPPGGSAAAAMAFLCFGSQTCAAPLAPNTTKPDTLSALDQFDAKHLVLFEGVDCDGVTAAFEEYGTQLGRAQLHIVTITGDHAPGFFTFADSSATKADLDAIGRPLVNPAEGDCLMLRTSGTTSKPKGVPIKQGPILANGAILAATIGLRPDDICYGIMPLFHIGGQWSKIALSNQESARGH